MTKWTKLTDEGRSEVIHDYLNFLAYHMSCSCGCRMYLVGINFYVIGLIEGGANIRITYRCSCGRKIEINESMIPKEVQ